MNKSSLIRHFCCALALLGLIACSPANPASATASTATTITAPALIPIPTELQTGVGQFIVDDSTRIYAEGEAAQRVAGLFNHFLRSAKRNEIPLDAKSGAIRLQIDPGAAASPEGYVLDIKADGISIRAADERGLFYGAVSLWQLLTQGDGERVTLPALTIKDAPRFGWRGLMLDSARHFQSVDEIKRLIDAMAVHKLNTFHWHLTDDQGWRVQIDKYPKLTEIGSCRIPGGDAGTDPATGEPATYCGYYTKDQIRDVVAYAGARHINVVPELDIPGHATAAIAAYPELGVVDTPLAVGNEWGIYPNLFNVEESTFQFLEDVLLEMTELFPGSYIHIGGDEAVKDQWIASKRVQERMRELGAKNEEDMQGIMLTRLQQFLAKNGKRVIGWDEILATELPPSAIVMSWRGIEGGIAAAKLGHDVIMTPVSHLYFDYLQTDSANEPPGRPSDLSLSKVYGFEPVPSELSAEQQKHILGLQANLWTEHTRSFKNVQHHYFPRIAAVAETGWSAAARKNFADFETRLQPMLKRYEAMGIEYAKTPYETATALSDSVRSDEQLGMCTGALRLRLEDDGPFNGERAVFNVDIFNPCWEWKQAKLQGISKLKVRAGNMPYVFQLAHDEPARKFKPAKSANGELVIRDGCEGAELANLPLPAKADADGFLTLEAALPPQTGDKDLCIYFTGDTRPTMWVLDQVELVK